MGTIKLRRGSGSPAGSLAQYEVAMDVAALNLYTSTDGSDAVILSDNTENFLANASSTVTINQKSLIDATAGGLTDPILELKTDNSGWNKTQILLTDSNDDAISLVGASLGNEYRLGIEFDPNNTNGRTGASSSAGDYAIIFAKDFSDAAATKITQKVYGANDGYELTIQDDYNAGTPSDGPFSPYSGGYGYKPYITNVEHFTVNAKDSNSSVAEALKVSNTAADFSVPVQLPNLTTTERNALAGATGMTIYNTSLSRIEYYDGAWKYITGTAV